MDFASGEPITTESSTTVDLYCPACGYSLRGIASDRCPECGLTIDRSSAAMSRIPWSHRVRIGRFRAYWRTNVMAILRPGRLADEIRRPVDFRDAQRFRHITVSLAWAPLVALGTWGYLSLIDVRAAPSVPPEDRLGWVLEVIALLSAAFSLWLFLLAGSGAGSYFFHPRRLPVSRQNRAIALSYYSCAPLAWLWLPCGLTALFAAVVSQPWGQHGFGATIGVGAWLGAIMSVTLIVLAGYVRTIQLMRRTNHRGVLRTLALAAYLPVAWAALCCITFLAIPAAVAFCSLVILSLR
jgi:hypothetical protein